MFLYVLHLLLAYYAYLELLFFHCYLSQLLNYCLYTLNNNLLHEMLNMMCDIHADMKNEYLMGHLIHFDN